MTVVIRVPIVSLEEHSGQGDEGVVQGEDEGEIRSVLKRLYLEMELEQLMVGNCRFEVTIAIDRRRWHNE